MTVLDWQNISTKYLTTINSLGLHDFTKKGIYFRCFDIDFPISFILHVPLILIYIKNSEGSLYKLQVF